jgi:hypothetical protein
MNKSVLIIAVLIGLAGVQASGSDWRLESARPDTLKADSVEHRLVVFDLGFETWLLTRPPRDLYSNDYYLIRNRLYVAEWNARYQSSENGGLYSDYIDYPADEDFGIDLNYRLFNYFKYFEMKNRVRLIGYRETP